MQGMDPASRCGMTENKNIVRPCGELFLNLNFKQRFRVFAKVAILVAVSLMILYQVLPVGVDKAHAVGTTKYAVNAGGNWSADATWSTVAAKDASRVADTVKPTAEDTVILDDYSGSVTIDATAVAQTLNCTGYTNTLTHNAVTLTVSGSVTLAATHYTTSGVATLAMNATGTLISAGNTLYNLTTSVGTITLGDGLTTNSAGTVTLTSGTLNTDGGAGSLTHNWGSFSSSNSTARTLTLGASNITITAGTTSAWASNNAANMTVTANGGTSVITLTGAGAAFNNASNGSTPKTYHDIVFNGGGAMLLNGVGTMPLNNLTVNNTAAKTDSFSLTGDPTIAGALTLAGNSVTNRLLVKSYIIGTPHTITVTGANLAGTDNVDFQDITFANGGSDVNFSAKSVGDCGGNTISGGGTLLFTPAAAQTWTNAAGGTWSTAGNWTSRVPLPQDDVWLGGLNGTGFVYNSGVTVTADMPRLGKSISWAGATWGGGTATTWNASSIANTSYGNMTLISGITFTTGGANYYYLSGRSIYTITSATKQFARLYINAPTGTYTLVDALSAIYEVNITAGNFSTAGNSVTVWYFFTSTGSITRSVNIANSLITISKYNGWEIADTGLTLTTTGSTIAYTYASGSNAQYFRGGAQTYNNITIAAGATSVLTFSGAFFFANMTMSSAGAKTVKFTKTTTYTMTGTSFLNGTAGNLVTIDSDDGATAFTMTKASGTVTADYVAKSRMQVTGATWYSTANSTPYPDPNTSGNTGWTASGSGNIRTISAAGGNWSAVGAWNEGIVPTASDNVFASPASGSITIDNASAVANSANFTSYVGTMTQTGTNTLTLSGSLTLVSGMTYAPASTSTVAFNSTAAGNTVTSAGKTLGNVTFNGVGGVWTLGDALASAATFTLTAGTFNASTFNVTCVNMTASGATTRVLQYGTLNTWTVSGNWDSSGTNQTETPGTSTVDLTGTGSLSMSSATYTFYNLKCARDTKITTVSGDPHIQNLLYVYSGGTLTSGTFYLYKSDGDPIVNTGMTFTGGGDIIYSSPASISVAGYNFGSRTVYYWGANDHTYTLSSNVTTTGSIYVYSATSGKTTTLDTAGFNLSCLDLTVGNGSTSLGTILLKAGSHTVARNLQRSGTGTTNTIDFGTGSISVGGNIDFTGITVTAGTGTQTVTMNATTTGKTITSAGAQFNNLTFAGTGGGWTLSENLVVNDFVNTAGAANIGDYQVTVNGNFSIAGGANSLFAQANTGTSYIILAGSGKTISIARDAYNPRRVKITGTYTAASTVIIGGQMAISGYGKLIIDGGTLAMGNQLFYFALNTTDSISIINGGDITGTGAWYWYGTNRTLPSFTLTASGTLDLFGLTYTLGGNVSVANKTIGNNQPAALNTSTYNLTAAGLTLGQATSNLYINLGSGTHTFSGSITNAGTATGNTLNFGTGSTTVGGSITLTNIAVTPGTSTVTMNATTTGKTITSAGNSFNNITFNGVGGGWTLADALVANATFTLTAGTFAASTFNVTCVNMTANGSTTRVLQYGTGNTWTVSGNWDSSGTNGTWTRGTSTVDLTGTGSLTASPTYYDFYNLKLAHDTKTTTVSGTVRVGNMFYVYSGGTLSGGYFMFGKTGADPIVNTGATFTGGGTIYYYPYRSNITVAGYNFGNWNVIYAQQNAGNANQTATLSSDVTTTGNIYTSSNTPGDLTILDTNTHNLSCANLYVGGDGGLKLSSGSHTVTGNLQRNGGATTDNTLDFGTGSISVGGNINFTGITVTAGTGTQTVTMNGAAQQNITSASQSFNNLTIKNTHANGVRPVDTLAVTGNLIVQADGASAVTLDNANNVAIGVTGNLATAGAGGGAKNIKMGTNTWTVGGNVDFTGGTVTKGTSTLVMNSSSAGQTLTSASNSLNNLTISNTNASGVTFADNSTVTGTFTDTTASSKLTFHATSAYAFANVSINGQADGTRIVMASSTPGTPWLFNVSTTQSVSRVDVADSNASGGLEITDPIGSNHNSGGNTNWVFISPTNPTTTNATVGGNAVTSGTWTNLSGAFNFTFSGALNGGVGSIAGYYIYLGTNAGANPVTDGTYQAHSGAIGDNQYYNSTLAAPDDGKYFYFIVKTKNNADNTSVTATLFDLSYDITLPLRPSFIAANPAGYTTVNLFTFSWPAGSDPNGLNGGASGIKWYEYKRATDGAWSHTTDANDRTVVNILAYQEGANVFYVRTIDNVGNISSDYQQVTYYWSGTAPAKPDNLLVTPGTSDSNSFTISWDKPAQGIGESPIVGYYYSINAYPTNLNTTYVASAADTVTIGPDAYASQQGVNTVYVLSVNAAGSRSFENAYVASATFNCQTPAMPIPTSVSLYDSSDRNLNRWMLTLQWVAGAGQDPSTFSHYIIYRSTDGIGFVQLATTTSTAYIDASGLDNTTTYYYNIKAVDNAGQESAQSATVSKMPTGNYFTPPALLSGPTATDIKVSSAKITWITDRASSSIVRYGTQINVFSASSGQFDSVTNHSVVLLGLTPGTVYYYQSQSLDENRDYSLEDAYSTTFSFTTLPAPTISNVKVYNITLSNADISWETTTVAHSTLYYGKTNAYGSSLDDQSGSGTTTHNVKLQSLNAGTTYHFKISGTDADGNVLTSDDYQFDTLPLPQIENLIIQPVSGKSQSAFKATWTTNVPTTTIIKYRLSTEADTQEQVKTKMEIVHEVIVEGLLDNSIYLIVAEGRDSLGNLAQSDTRSFRTSPDTTPPIISNIIIETSNVGRGQQDTARIAVSWKTDEPATSMVEYGKGLSGGYNSKTIGDKTLTVQHLVIVSDLTPSVPYHLRVVSADKANNIAKSGNVTAITGEVQKSILQLILDILNKMFGWMGVGV